MESFSLILGIIALIGLFFLLRWLIPSKGKVGEKVVAGKLDRLPKDQYRVLNNVTIPTPKGSSQIDHLIVSIFGIFVIETKNYNGWIYGLMGKSAVADCPAPASPRKTGRHSCWAAPVWWRIIGSKAGCRCIWSCRTVPSGACREPGQLGLGVPGSVPFGLLQEVVNQ